MYSRSQERNEGFSSLPIVSCDSESGAEMGRRKSEMYVQRQLVLGVGHRHGRASKWDTGTLDQKDDEDRVRELE